MEFKVDENLPSEVCELLRQAGHDAISVLDQKLGGRPDDEIATVCRTEGRALLTLDTDFANILAYPPADYHGIVVIRTEDQSKFVVTSLVRQAIGVLGSERLEQHLWIVEMNRVRIRGPE